MSDEKKDIKETTEASEPITIRVREQTGEETFFKIKTTTKMGKVLKAFSEKKGVQIGSFRFLIDGQAIHDNDTPKSLDLEDQDQIDCVLAQVGGGLDVIVCNNASIM